MLSELVKFPSILSGSESQGKIGNGARRNRIDRSVKRRIPVNSNAAIAIDPIDGDDDWLRSVLTTIESTRRLATVFSDLASLNGGGS